MKSNLAIEIVVSETDETLIIEKLQKKNCYSRLRLAR